MSATRTTFEELATLISALRAWGLDYLVDGSTLRPAPAIPPANLLQRLARSPEPRVRDAVIAVMLLHPELAEVLPATLAAADQETREQLIMLVLAALYLQRIWLTQLTLSLGHLSQFPEAPFTRLWEARQLPPFALGYGEPGDFIPLPASWQRQAQYIGRYGPLEVFSFDYYSLALSKIKRGAERDLQDVALLGRQGWITREMLDAAYQEILPQMGHGRYFNRDAARFTQQYQAAVQRVWAEEQHQNDG